MEVLYVVGFFVGVQNVIGGAAHQVLLAQMAGRKRLVEANAKISLGETSAALVGPGLAGLMIQAVTAPFAILLDALAFLGSALLLRRVRVRSDVPHQGPRASVNSEIVEGLKLVWHNRTLFALAWVAGLWQLLHHMQMAVLVLFATRDLGLSAGAIGFAYMFGGFGCVLAAASAGRLSNRHGVGPVILLGLLLTVCGWVVYGLIGGPVWFATVALGLGMLLFDFGGVTWGINYLALRQAITPDRLLGRMTATMRFLTVAAAPVGSLAGGVLGTVIGLRGTLWVIAFLGVLLGAAALAWSPVRGHRVLPAAAD
jgi:predicted MFS family arabinose efflux permease